MKILKYLRLFGRTQMSDFIVLGAYGSTRRHKKLVATFMCTCGFGTQMFI